MHTRNGGTNQMTLKEILGSCLEKALTDIVFSTQVKKKSLPRFCLESISKAHMDCTEPSLHGISTSEKQCFYTSSTKLQMVIHPAGQSKNSVKFQNQN